MYEMVVSCLGQNKMNLFLVGLSMTFVLLNPAWGILRFRMVVVYAALLEAGITLFPKLDGLVT